MSVEKVALRFSSEAMRSARAGSGAVVAVIAAFVMVRRVLMMVRTR